MSRKVQELDEEFAKLATDDGNPSEQVYDAHFSSDGSRLFTAGFCGRCIVSWNTTTWEQEQTINLKNSVISCHPTPDGTQILASSSSCGVQMFDIATNTELWSHRHHAGHIFCCACAPSADFVASCATDKKLILCEASSGSLVATLVPKLEDFRDKVSRCCFSPKSNTILAANYGNQAVLWDVQTQHEIVCISHPNQGLQMYDCCFVPTDESIVVTASNDHTARVWDTRSPTCVCVLHNTHSVYSCSASPDGSLIMVGGSSRYLSLWDARVGRTLARLKGPKGAISTCRFSPTQQIAVTCSARWSGCEYVSRLWDLQTLLQLREMPGHTSWKPLK